MKFPTIDAAQEWSTRHGTRIFVEIEGAPKELNAIVDTVLAYKPKPKSKAAKKRKRRRAKHV
jgi:hypothetical protein